MAIVKEVIAQRGQRDFYLFNFIFNFLKLSFWGVGFKGRGQT